MLSEKIIRKYLSPEAKSIDIQTYECVSSTNDLIKHRAESMLASEKKEALIVASEQSAGRGRRGRSFFRQTARDFI